MLFAPAPAPAIEKKKTVWIREITNITVPNSEDLFCIRFVLFLAAFVSLLVFFCLPPMQFWPLMGVFIMMFRLGLSAAYPALTDQMANQGVDEPKWVRAFRQTTSAWACLGTTRAVWLFAPFSVICFLEFLLGAVSWHDTGTVPVLLFWAAVDYWAQPWVSIQYWLLWVLSSIVLYTIQHFWFYEVRIQVSGLVLQTQTELDEAAQL
jgi:hypothetical protein